MPKHNQTAAPHYWRIRNAFHLLLFADTTEGTPCAFEAEVRDKAASVSDELGWERVAAERARCSENNIKNLKQKYTEKQQTHGTEMHRTQETQANTAAGGDTSKYSCRRRHKQIQLQEETGEFKNMKCMKSKDYRKEVNPK